MTTLSTHEQDPAHNPAYLIAEEVHPRWVRLAMQRNAKLISQGKPRKSEMKELDLNDPRDLATRKALLAEGSQALVCDGQQCQVNMWLVPFGRTPRRIQDQNISSSQQALDKVHEAMAGGVDYRDPAWRANTIFGLYVNYRLMNDADLLQRWMTTEQALQDPALVQRLQQEYAAMDTITRQMDNLFLDVAVEFVGNGTIQ